MKVIKAIYSIIFKHWKEAALFYARHATLLIFIPLCAKTQTFSYQHFGLTDGMPSNEVYQVYQARNGYIWFATDNGVARYDGNRIQNFEAKNELTDPVVFDIQEDIRGKLWFRTFSGKICYLENGRIKPYKFNNIIESYSKKTLMLSLYIDSLNQVWFGTGEALGKIDSAGRYEVTKIKPRQVELQNLDNGSVYGCPWPHHLVDKIRIDGKLFMLHLSDTLTDVINIPLIRLGNDMLLCVGRDLFQYSDGKILKVFSSKSQIISLSIDRGGYVWVGFMKGGVAKLNPQTFAEEFKPLFLASLSVTKVLNDNQEGFWFSTLENGVYRVSDFNMIFFESKARIRAAAKSGNKVFLGLEDGSVAQFDSRNFKSKIIKEADFLPIQSVLADRFHRLWVSSTVKTHLYDTSCNLIKTYSIGQSDLFESRDHVMGIGRVHVKRYSLTDFGVEYFNITGLYRSIFGYDSLFVLTGRTGLDVYDNRFAEKKYSHLFSNAKITEVLSLNDSLLVVCTLGSGFFVVDKLTWGSKYFFNVTVTGSNVHYAEIIDERVWISTERGILMIPVIELLKKKLSFKMVPKQVLSNRIKYLLFTDPYVIAFADYGFYIIPKKINLESDPIFQIESLFVNNRPVALDSIRVLKSDDNNLRLDFSFISFNGHDMFIRSRLHEKDFWSNMTGSSLSFNSLAPGQYDIEIEYSTDNFNWKQGMKWSFQILRPWWLDLRVHVVVIAILIAILIFYLRRRLSLIREREEVNRMLNDYRQKLITIEMETLERDRARIARDLHDSIGCNLAALKYSIATLFRKYEDPMVQRMEKDLQQSIEEIRGIIRGLTPHGLDTYRLVDVISDYINRITFTTLLEKDIQSSGEEFSDKLINLTAFRIVQELLSNTLKHSQAKKIAIHLYYSNQNLRLVYQDDGKGFKDDGVSKGFGLSSIKSRVQALNAKLIFKSQSGVYYEIDIPFSESNVTN